MLGQRILMILRLLLNTLIIWMIFIKILRLYLGYIPNNKHKKLIVSDDMIAHILNNEKRNPTVTELFIRGRNLNILLFLLQPKDID